MKSQAVLLGVKQAILSSESDLWRHVGVRPLAGHEAPLAEHQVPRTAGCDFSRVPVHASGPEGGQVEAICPLTPRRCPFGGACHTCPTHVQAKLAISQPGDELEREADRVADRAMRASGMQLQRRTAGQVEPTPVPPIVPEVLRSPGQPLDAVTRAFFEPRFGHDFGQVRVHSDAKAAESARLVSALAYSVGRDVVFGAQQYSPGTSDGKRLLAHELAHLVQQRHQRSPQGQLKIGTVDDGLEREADAASLCILRNQNAPDDGILRLGNALQGVVQRRAIHRGRILFEGTCEFLACNSRWACEDEANGLACPDGTRNAYSKTKKKYRPLFTCDTGCEENRTCEDNDSWMAIPHSRFARRKCNQHLVICANGRSTHAYVRDRSSGEYWEVGPGITDALGVPRGTFSGSIYGDVKDPEFLRDRRCRPVASATVTGMVGDIASFTGAAAVGAGGAVTGAIGGAIGAAVRSLDEL